MYGKLQSFRLLAMLRNKVLRIEGDSGSVDLPVASTRSERRSVSSFSASWCSCHLLTMKSGPVLSMYLPRRPRNKYLEPYMHAHVRVS